MRTRVRGKWVLSGGASIKRYLARLCALPLIARPAWRLVNGFNLSASGRSGAPGKFLLHGRLPKIVCVIGLYLAMRPDRIAA